MSFFPFLLNKCNILRLENKTFPLSSKETRLKNNDKILSQFTNRLGMYQLFSKQHAELGGCSNQEIYLERSTVLQPKMPWHFAAVPLSKTLSGAQMKEQEDNVCKYSLIVDMAKSLPYTPFPTDYVYYLKDQVSFGYVHLYFLTLNDYPGSVCNEDSWLSECLNISATSPFWKKNLKTSSI